MRVIDRDLLKRFAQAPRCEFCHRAGPVDGAHIYSRGAGRVDIAENLCSLCRCCHSLSHNGQEPTREQLLEIAAKREGTTAEKITEKVNGLRNETSFKAWEIS